MSKISLPPSVRELLDLPLLSAAALLSAVLTLTGGFGSFAIVMPLRLAYWLLTLMATSAALLLLRKVIIRRVERPIWIGLTTILVAAIPSATAAGSVASILGLRTAPGWSAFAVIGCSVTPPLYVLWRMLHRRDPPEGLSLGFGRDEAIPPALAAKLPLRLARSRLIAIEAQDHYLRLITDAGEALVHMRLAEAITALTAADGLQVHRSWWVATDAVDDVRLAGGRGMITLTNNLRVPVSRSFATDAQAKLCT